MKKLIVIMVLFAIALNACKKPDEVPPYKTTYEREFGIPQPSLLTDWERAEIEARTEEYESSINK